MKSFICNHNRGAILFAFVLGLLLSLAGASPALAQNGEPSAIPDDAVNAIASEMYCPVCENIPLDVCGTQACHQWRELIREKLADGWTEEQIKEYFVAQYGDRVLAEPPREGLHWLVYIVPPLVLVLALVVVFQVMRAWRRPTTALAPTEPSAQTAVTPQDDYTRRLEEELRKRD